MECTTCLNDHPLVIHDGDCDRWIGDGTGECICGDNVVSSDGYCSVPVKCIDEATLWRMPKPLPECHADHCTKDPDGVDGKCMFHSTDDLWAAAAMKGDHMAPTAFSLISGPDTGIMNGWTRPGVWVFTCQRDTALEEMQDHVGGLIEVVGAVGETGTGWLCVANEEGRLKNLPTNSMASALCGHRIVGDVIIIPRGQLE